ncbi:MAG: MoaD/ThiS family protein [Gammaproteobacteria bacterium]|nr:MoaD/ThiS family protein [Gammaproteobacteria bacterium]
MTANLLRFFPVLEGREIDVAAGSVAEVLRAVDAIAPGFSDYVLDERGALRRHVNVCVDQRLVIDRQTLSDRVGDNATLHIFQALSGG